MSHLPVLSVPHLDLTSQLSSLSANGHEYKKRSAGIHSALFFFIKCNLVLQCLFYKFLKSAIRLLMLHSILLFT